MKNLKLALLILVSSIIFFGVGAEKSAAALLRLQVSDNQRFFTTEDGTPFFWMGDTAWSIATIPPADVDLYLNNRAQKGFNLIHVDTDAYGANNYNNQRPFLIDNTDTPNIAWWNYIDEIVNKAAAKEMYVCIFPMWSQIWDKTHIPQYFGGYRLFNGDTAKARRFGEWIGNRYKNRTNVIWSVAGEFDKLTGTGSTAIYEAVAQGIETAYQNAGLSPLMTIHPAAMSYYTSSYKFHNSSWLDFNMLQSGHTADLGLNETYNIISHDYNLTPSTPKPTIEGEPTYEGIVRWDGNTIPNNEAVSRRKIYWSVFAGGFGVTYGHGSVQKMNNPLEDIPLPWKDALNAPVGGQMIYLRNLMESLPDYFNRIPDQSVVTSLNPAGIDHVQATRDADGKYALVYIPNGATVTVDMAKISGTSADASWYNPRTGESTAIGNFSNSGTRTFDAPGATAEGNDWVLVLKTGGVAAHCFDGMDNDGDGKSDFGYGSNNDPGCTHANDNAETGDPSPENGLVARWSLDANHINQNIAYDSSTQNNHGTLSGAVGAGGKINEARLFNGTSDNINISHDAAFASSNGTFAAWFKIDDLNKKSQAIFGKDASGCVGDCGHFYMVYNDEYYSTRAPYAANKLLVRFQNNSTSYFLLSDDAKKQIQAGVWHHIAVAFGSGGLKLYVDGVLHDTDTHSEGVAGNQESLSLGNYYEANYGLKGSLDDVRIYNKALTEEEINNLPGFTAPTDVNGDTHVNIKDIQACIKVITQSNMTYQDQCRVLAAPDLTTNIKDIQIIIRAIIGG